jgi:hypothetical protein
MNNWIENIELVKQMKDLTENIKNLTEGTKTIIHATGKVIFYLTHPAQFGWLLWSGAVQYSFYVCLIIFMVSVVLYLVGVKKARKWAHISVFSYIAIQVFNAVSR